MFNFEDDVTDDVSQSRSCAGGAGGEQGPLIAGLSFEHPEQEKGLSSKGGCFPCLCNRQVVTQDIAQVE